MKKEYRKPEIAVESFQLDATFAESCSSQDKATVGFSQESCDLSDEIGIPYFASSACEMDVTDGDSIYIGAIDISGYFAS